MNKLCIPSLKRGTTFSSIPESHSLKTDSVPGSMVCSFMDETEEDTFGQQEVVIKRSKKQVANPKY
jgi:hypothetical protein